MSEIKKLLLTGGVLRYRPPHGFYVVLAGKAHKVDQAEARKAVEAKLVRPNGIDQHGVYLFAANMKAINAPVPALQRNPQALPARPAAVPNALPDVHPLRGTLDSETAAAVPADAGAAQGQVPGRAGAVAGDGTQRERVAGAGQGCVGCGACAGKGVTP